MFRFHDMFVRDRRRGIVALLVVASLTLLMGIVAVSLDGGMLFDNKRLIQNTADSAAMAAANVLFKNAATIASSGVADPGGAAATAATSNATTNGYTTNGTDTTVTVNIPPASGAFKNLTGYAEVIVTYKQPAYFSTVWGVSSTQISARAVAKGFWGATGNGVIVLDPSAKDALRATGGASGTVSGGAAMVVDSANTEAAVDSGGGVLTASQFDITGGYSGVFVGTVYTGTLPIPDPLAYLPVPTVTTNGTVTQTALGNGNHQFVLTPGRHTNLPSVQTGDVVIFKQASYDGAGIYYIDGGGFTSQGATIQMDTSTSGGVMIYNAPRSTSNNQGVQITGNSAGSVSLSALTSGPYSGILMWQDRSSTVNMNISGQGSFNLSGTFYTANALLTVSGNGTATIGSQYISRTLSLTGNGVVNIAYSDNSTGRKRDIRLVE